MSFALVGGKKMRIFRAFSRSSSFLLHRPRRGNFPPKNFDACGPHPGTYRKFFLQKKKRELAELSGLHNNAIGCNEVKSDNQPDEISLTSYLKGVLSRSLH